MLERGVGKLLKETVDDGDVLSLFRPQYGKIYHRSNVRAHFVCIRWLLFIVVPTGVTSRGLSNLSRNVKTFPYRINPASIDLIVTSSS